MRQQRLRAFSWVKTNLTRGQVKKVSKGKIENSSCWLFLRLLFKFDCIKITCVDAKERNTVSDFTGLDSDSKKIL